MELEALKKEIQNNNLMVDGVYNFLGSRVGQGKETFTLIDKTYCI